MTICGFLMYNNKLYDVIADYVTHKFKLFRKGEPIHLFITNLLVPDGKECHETNFDTYKDFGYQGFISLGDGIIQFLDGKATVWFNDTQFDVNYGVESIRW